jgi:hypothetical protein
MNESERVTCPACEREDVYLVQGRYVTHSTSMRGAATICSLSGRSPEAEAEVEPGEGLRLNPPTPEQLIEEECMLLKELLLRKNAAYGNSALDPVRIFSKASIEEQILVRLDDKLSRLARGSLAGEDVEQDIMGYLVLLRVGRKLARMTPGGRQ